MHCIVKDNFYLYLYLYSVSVFVFILLFFSRCQVLPLPTLPGGQQTRYFQQLIRLLYWTVKKMGLLRDSSSTAIPHLHPSLTMPLHSQSSIIVVVRGQTFTLIKANHCAKTWSPSTIVYTGGSFLLEAKRRNILLPFL